MKNKWLFKWLTVSLLIFFAISISFVSTARSVISDTSNNNIDLVLIIDQSNSMFTQSDMNGLRFEAAKVATDMLSMDNPNTKSQIGLVIFGNPGKAEEVFPLTPISNPNNVSKIKSKIDKIKNRDLWNTDIKNGLEVAYKTMEKGHISTNKPVFVIITDGQPYLGKKWYDEGQEKPYLQDVMNTVVPEFKNRKWLIFTLALGMGAIKNDSEKKFYKNFWNDLSTTTNGLYFEAVNEDDLVAEFLQILSLFTGKNTDISTIKVQNETVKQWKINPAFVKSLSFIFVKKSPDSTLTIIRPNGDKIDKNTQGIEYSKNDKSTVYKIPVLPTDVDTGSSSGTWKAIIQGDSTVTIALVLSSDLKLVIDNPVVGQLIPINASFIIKAHFSYKGKVISAENLSPQITALISKDGKVVETVKLYDDGEHNDGRSNDGFFGSSNVSLNQIGDYKLKLTGNIYSSTIDTVQSLVVHNIPAIGVSITPKTLIVGQAIKITAQFLYNNSSEKQDLSKHSTPITINVVAPDGKQEMIQNVTSSDGKYIFEYTPKETGKYTVIAESKVYGSPIKQNSTFNTLAKLDISLKVNKSQVIQGSTVKVAFSINNIKELPDALAKSLSIVPTLTLPNGGNIQLPLPDISKLKSGSADIVINSDNFKQPGNYILNCAVTGSGIIKTSKSVMISVVPQSLSINVKDQIIPIKVNSKKYTNIPIAFSNVQLSEPVKVTVKVKTIQGTKNSLQIPTKAANIKDNIILIKPDSKEVIQNIEILLTNKNYKIKPGIYDISFGFLTEPPIKTSVINPKVKLSVHVPTPFYIYLIILLLILGGGAGVYYFYMSSNSPKLNGELIRIDSNGNETEDEYDLYNKRIFKIGNKPGVDLMVDVDTKKPSVLCIIRPTGTKGESRNYIEKVYSDVDLLINGESTNASLLHEGDIIKIGEDRFKFKNLEDIGLEDEEETNLEDSEGFEDLLKNNDKGKAKDDFDFNV